jgi:hypothetical protein
MGKQDPTPREVETNDRWEQEPDEDFGGFCPTCQVQYPASQAGAHADH